MTETHISTLPRGSAPLIQSLHLQLKKTKKQKTVHMILLHLRLNVYLFYFVSHPFDCHLKCVFKSYSIFTFDCLMSIYSQNDYTDLTAGRRLHKGFSLSPPEL